MPIETAVQIFAVIHLGAVGVSHITAHEMWTRFFIRLREWGEPGIIVVAFLSLGFGSIIAAFHPVWSGLPLVLTLVGWGQVLKGVVYLAFPKFGLKRLEMVTLERSRMFMTAGVGLLVIAGVVLVHLLR